jgi:flagellin-like hook-associated protein FlgL
LGNGDGSFKTEVVYTSGDKNGTESIQVADINGDARLDIVTVNTDSSMSVVLGNGDGSFKAPQSYALTVAPMSGVLADVNSDGILDVVTGYNSYINICLGNGVQRNGLPEISLLSQAEARTAIDKLYTSLDSINMALGQIGATESRFASVLHMLPTTIDNYASAAARITDVDVAEESSNLIRLQILQKAATAVLAQANNNPLIALSLLKS